MEIVHCLDCDDVYKEKDGEYVEVCPHCGNTETADTVYLSHDNEIYKEMVNEVNKENA